MFDLTPGMLLQVTDSNVRLYPIFGRRDGTFSGLWMEKGDYCFVAGNKTKHHNGLRYIPMLHLKSGVLGCLLLGTSGKYDCIYFDLISSP